MIIVRFTSGLGNQMFQYSLYSFLREKFPQTRVLADVTWFGRSSEHQGYELKRIFEREDNPDFVLEEATNWEIFRVTGRFPNTRSGALGDLWQNILKIPHNIIRLTAGSKYQNQRIDQSGFEDNGEIYEKLMNLDPKKDWYITGFYIEEVYYRDRLESLRKMLKFPPFEVDENRQLAKEIADCDSVSIHVRRGDYLSAQYNQSFIALPMDYYKKAISLVLEENPNSRFFIFSDDKDFIREQFDWIENLTIVTGNSGKNSFRDMQLMSLCKKNIIANSTFSVWAGLLNANADAKVYYPKQYMHEKDSEVKTIPGWIRVEN